MEYNLANKVTFFTITKSQKKKFKKKYSCFHRTEIVRNKLSNVVLCIVSFGPSKK